MSGFGYLLFVEAYLDDANQRRYPMKSLKCDLCEFVAQGETFEDWMRALMPHYLKAHTDVMNDPKNGEQDRENWMAENRARFDAA